MNIVFLTQWFDPEPGAMRGLPLAKWLVARGHDVKVLTGFPNYPGGRIYEGYKVRPWMRETMSGIPVLRVPLYPSHDASALRRILNYTTFAASAASLGAALIGRADVVYAYHPPPTIGLAAIVMKALRRAPYVYHIADLWPESVVESDMVGSPAAKRIARAGINAWLRPVYGLASAITVHSPRQRDILAERGVPPHKVHVSYNWTDEEVFRPLPYDRDLAVELGMDGKFNVVYAGNLGPFQKLDTLIEAAAAIKDRAPNVQIVVIGTGFQEAHLKNTAAHLRATNVRFVPRREFWEMPKINALADVLVVHLRRYPFFRATLPSKTQVAMACSKPLLMAVEGDSADVVRRSGAGLVVEPEDPTQMAEAILGFAGMDREELTRMGERGREFYRDNMSLDIGARGIEKVLATASGVGVEPEVEK